MAKTFTYPQVAIQIAGVSTEAKQDVGNASLATIAAKDFATQTTLAALNAKDFATQTTSAAILAKIIAAPATEAKQDIEITSLQLLDDVVSTTGSAISTKSAQISGSDGTLARVLKTDAAGELQVDILTSALPTGASTSAAQVTMEAAINTLLKPANTLAAVTTVGTVTTVSAVTSITNSVTIKADTAINQTNALKVDGSAVTQPISAASLPLPTGASTSANQTTTNASLASIDTKTPALGQALAAASVPVVLTAAQLSTLTPLTSVTANAGTNLNTSLLALDSTVAKDASLTTINNSINTLLKPANTLAAVTTVSTVTTVGAVTSITNALPAGTNNIGDVDVLTLPAIPTGTNSIGSVGINGKVRANAPVRNAYATTSVTTAAYVQLVASTTIAATEIEIFDSSGQTLVLAFGAAAAEIDQIYIFPGGNGKVTLAVPAATRVSVKAVSATASVGELLVNFYG